MSVLQQFGDSAYMSSFFRIFGVDEDLLSRLNPFCFMVTRAHWFWDAWQSAAVNTEMHSSEVVNLQNFKVGIAQSSVHGLVALPARWSDRKDLEFFEKKWKIKNWVQVQGSGSSEVYCGRPRASSRDSTVFVRHVKSCLLHLTWRDLTWHDLALQYLLRRCGRSNA